MLEQLTKNLLEYINNTYGNIAILKDTEIIIVRRKETIRFEITSTKDSYLENECNYGIHRSYENKKGWYGSGSYEKYENNNIIDDFLIKHGFNKQELQTTIFDFIEV